MNDYLISGIPVVDNESDGHIDLDVELRNVTANNDFSDVTADTTLKFYGYNANLPDMELVLTGSGVSLTGAGGGLPACNITLVPKFNNEIVSGPFFTWQIAGNAAFSEENDHAGITQGNDPESTDEFTFPRQIFNPGSLAIYEMFVADSGGTVVWDGTEPVNFEGSASWDSDNNRIILTGDCTITFNAFRD